ncbi:hypothetical protein [Maledivibacter halophilus]|uniref:Zinc-ribbon domain-containing protein n=1 Tax=Maledivibacter halophilus TaxID=36842 RepID=A0A1T5M1T3_9FIRM|nr:hypothetical protein [Maledivibacter halophilus]SKC82212.1 hypothetical protein SAMN02194393_03725 [Maledivibacter halophilus]
MAVIVQHKETLKKFIFLGVGYGTYKATRPSFLGGNLFPNEDEGETRVAAVCDKEGNIIWFPPKDLKVIEIDGVNLKNLSELFDEEKDNADSLEVCLECGHKIYDHDESCSSCGRSFVHKK